MKELLILRHAKSSWSNADLPDHDRPLNQRGERDAPRIGRFMFGEGIAPDHIVSSDAVRAESTAVGVAEACGYTRAIELDDDLYLTGVAEYLAAIRRVGDNRDRALIVGHNPTVEGLTNALTGAHVIMPTGALALVKLDIDRWRDVNLGDGHQLAGFWLPKELPEEDESDEENEMNPEETLQTAPGVGPVIAGRLVAAGYNSLGKLAGATAEEVAEAADLRPALAESIVDYARLHADEDADEEVEETIIEIDEDALLISVALTDILGKKARRHVVKKVGSKKFRKRLIRELRAAK